MAQLFAGESGSLPSAATPAKKAKGAAAAEAPVKTGRATTGHAPFSLLPLAAPDVTARPDVRPSVGAPFTMMGPAGASVPMAAQAAHAKGVAAREAAVDALRSGCVALPASMQECHRAAELATTVSAFVDQVAHQFTLDLEDQAAAILNFTKKHTADDFAKAAQTFGATTATRKRTAEMADLMGQQVTAGYQPCLTDVVAGIGNLAAIVGAPVATPVATLAAAGSFAAVAAAGRVGAPRAPIEGDSLQTAMLFFPRVTHDFEVLSLVLHSEDMMGM